MLQQLLGRKATSELAAIFEVSSVGGKVELVDPPESWERMRTILRGYYWERSRAPASFLPAARPMPIIDTLPRDADSGLRTATEALEGAQKDLRVAQSLLRSAESRGSIRKITEASDQINKVNRLLKENEGLEEIARRRSKSVSKADRHIHDLVNCSQRIWNKRYDCGWQRVVRTLRCQQRICPHCDGYRAWKIASFALANWPATILHASIPITTDVGLGTPSRDQVERERRSWTRLATRLKVETKPRSVVTPSGLEVFARLPEVHGTEALSGLVGAGIKAEVISLPQAVQRLQQALRGPVDVFLDLVKNALELLDQPGALDCSGLAEEAANNVATAILHYRLEHHGRHLLLGARTALRVREVDSQPSQQAVGCGHDNCRCETLLLDQEGRVLHRSPGDLVLQYQGRLDRLDSVAYHLEREGRVAG